MKRNNGLTQVAICDRCGEELVISDHFYFQSIILKEGWFTLHVNSSANPAVHLCPKCADDFERWYKQQDHTGKAKRFRQ